MKKVKHNPQPVKPVETIPEPTTTDSETTVETVVQTIAVTPPEKEVVEKTVTVQPIAEDPNAVPTVYGFINKLHRSDFTADTVSGSLHSVLIAMDNYSSRMGSRTPVDESIGAAAQRELLQAFYTALDAVDEVAPICLDAILYHFKYNINGAFSERLIFRFVNIMGVTSDNRNLFEKLCYLFLNISSPAKRRSYIAVTDFNSFTKLLPLTYSARLLRYIQS